LEFANWRVVQDGGIVPKRSGIVPVGFSHCGNLEGKKNIVFWSSEFSSDGEMNSPEAKFQFDERQDRRVH